MAVAPPAAASAPSCFPFPVWAALFALSGFVALSLEIVWFRLLGVILKSNAFTFATLLAVYLLGVGGGAFWDSRLARRSERPTAVFLLLQALVPAYAALALAAFVHGVPQGFGPALVRDYLTRYETLDLARTLAAIGSWRAGIALDEQGTELVHLFGWLYGAVPLFLFGPPTLMMGLSFPFLQKATQTDPAVLGRRVGLLQAANILGCTFGAALTGLGLLAWLGSAGTSVES